MGWLGLFIDLMVGWGGQGLIIVCLAVNFRAGMEGFLIVPGVGGIRLKTRILVVLLNKSLIYGGCGVGVAW